MTTFNVSATTYLLNYLPEYVASDQGFFTDAGLEVTNTPRIPWDLVLDDLADGSAQAALGGIWVPAMYHGRGRELRAFAQIANRAPFALVGRATTKPFDWPELRGRTVTCVGATGASVAIYAKVLMAENGVDPREVNFIQDLDNGILSQTFRGGMADYFVTDDMTADALSMEDDLCIRSRFVEDGGQVPWSVYYSDLDVPVDPAAQAAFAGALDRAMDWIASRDAAEFEALLGRLFPKSPARRTVQVANLYRANDMWSSSVIPRQSYDRWQRGICDNFLIDAPLPYETLVTGRDATRVSA
ncbi:ABC transporter substrate-binding protein [Salipiger abyssi]|uniref:Thiamine pyrimidine synthase n=1 Tax=Salipiger abyssi TaxID=1250539 RepID=A0A1P8UW58_9RHOB|nr:ABC transporter substrate-binding protein [Salipiger abyssi]APZ53621.1 NitT/TauT family transport system substrate-binding protein [Salipiger abyssi]